MLHPALHHHRHPLPGEGDGLTLGVIHLGYVRSREGEVEVGHQISAPFRGDELFKRYRTALEKQKQEKKR